VRSLDNGGVLVINDNHALIYACRREPCQAP
jgi:hypothetical protein